MENTDLERVLSPEQIAEVARLANIIWHECYSDILVPKQIDYMVEKFQSLPALTAQIQNQGYEYSLLHAKGEPAGYLGLVPDIQKGRLLLSKLYLLQSARGKGYAKKALAFTQARAQTLGCPVVWLTVNRYNKRALASYLKDGFVLAGTQDADIGGGYVMEDYILEKQI